MKGSGKASFGTSDDATRQQRPDHPDFWELSGIVIALDADVEGEGASPINEVVAKVIDPRVLAYMAEQRSMLFFERLGLPIEPVETALMGSSWVDGFLAGVEWGKAHGPA